MDYKIKCNTYEEKIFNNYNIFEYNCPSCGAKHSLTRHGSYDRNFIYIENGDIKTVTGKDEWQINSLRVILSNEKYYGDALLQKTFTENYLTGKRKVNKGELPKYRIKDNHPAIISKEEFEKVQKMIEKRAKDYGNTPEIRHKYSNRYAFSGKIICGKCNKPFKRRIWNGKDIMWQCSTYINKGKDECDMKAVKDSVVKEEFVKMFNELIENKENFLLKLDRNIEKGKSLEKVKDELRVLVRKEIKGEIDKESYKKQYEELSSKLENKNENTEKIKKLLKSSIEKFDEKIFLELIEKIIVKNPNNIKFIRKKEGENKLM